MIIIFGPAGSGKSVQGQILAARHNWRWLSAGQLLRDTHDLSLLQQMQTGELVNPEIVNQIMNKAFHKAKDIDHVVLDGFPRQLEQAKWLLDTQPQHKRAVNLVVVLDVPKEELIRRIQLRGRADDTAKAIEERLAIFAKEINPIIAFFKSQDIRVTPIDGTGTVGQVHDRIEAELQLCSLV
jgi:adenylate kinase